VPTERIAAPAPNVVSLMDALKRSLAAEEAKTTSTKQAKPKKPEKSAVEQREMLLTITGKGGAEKKAKEQPASKPTATRQRKAG